MDFGEIKIYDFSGYRFYYGLRDRSNVILVKTHTAFVDLLSFERYGSENFNAFLRLTKPEIIYIHDNLEVRLDKRIVVDFMKSYPDYAEALMRELSRMSIFASNLRFHLNELLNKIKEILEDYSGTSYHSSQEEKKHFIKRIIANFDRYMKLDVLALNWVNFIDCLAQVKSVEDILVFNTWRSFLFVKNHHQSGYSEFYYKFSTFLYDELEANLKIKLINLDEGTIDGILNQDMKRIHDSVISTTSPIKNI